MRSLSVPHLSVPHLFVAAGLLAGLATAPSPLRAATATAAPAAAVAAPSIGDSALLAARDALRSRDRARLVALRNELIASGHPLARWADYWELGNRLAEAQQAELEAFYARWPGSYVEDRLRNDWLLELGRRRDWVNFKLEFPRFRMNDDREVTCYALLTQHLDGQNVRAEARATWLAQRDGDEACALLTSRLVDDRALSADDVWLAARAAAEANRPRAARQAAALTGPNGAAAANAVDDLFKDPLRYLQQLPAAGAQGELVVMALTRLAAADPELTAGQIENFWQRQLSIAQLAAAWAQVAKQAGFKQLPMAQDLVQRAWRLRSTAARQGHELPRWSDELLAWQVRTALRLPATDPQRWPSIARAIDAMSAAEQRDSTWIYWRARARRALAAAGADGDAAREQARLALEGLSSQQGFYAKLATEELGRRVSLPEPPEALTPAELETARQHPGLQRALQLIALGLRNEGVREWNYSLRGMAERELLAAAQQACDREIWDRCINTSERTRGTIDMAQRFPTPFREQVLAQARETGIDPAFKYGLIRQESRFINATRSNVGATGLMQLMPATASWTARKIGLEYRPTMISDRATNLRLGTSYLKLVLDDFGGSQALAAAAYNAGPARSRRWREGPFVEAAAWAESIPFNETRDYVKKVLSNAVDYTLVLAQPAPPEAASLKARLGPLVGPREPGAAGAVDRDLP